MEVNGPPCVGIFWVHRGDILARICAVGDGADDGEFVNSSFDHVNSWLAIQRRERTRFPELSALEYQDVPRGRVLYNKRRSVFMCYLDRAIDSSAIRAAITTAFVLPTGRVYFQPDAHYTTDPGDLDRLFRD